MGKKKKRVRKGKRKQHARQRDQTAFDNSSDQNEISDSETLSDDESSHHHCLARTVNCFTCLKPKQSSSNKPSVGEIMDILRRPEPTMKDFQNSLQLLNILVDNYEPPIDEIRYVGLDTILIEGMQFKNAFIQYYAIHALSVIAKSMTEEQLKSLISQGLKQGITAVLERDAFLIVQEDEEIRSVVLDVVFEVVSNEDFIIIFENSYLAIILQFFDSAIEDEAKAALSIVGYFVKQHSKNTNTLLRMGLIEKIMPLLAHHSAPEFDFEASSILQNLLSRKKYAKYVGSIVNSGLVLWFLKHLDEDTSDFKNEACVTLRLLNEVWKRKQAMKVANPQHIRIMCNILKSSNDEHIACSVALIYSLLKACSDLQAHLQLQQAKTLLKESNACKYIEEFIERTKQNIMINHLACEMRTLYLNIEGDSDEECHAEIEELCIQNSGSSKAETGAIATDETKISHSKD